MAKEEWYFYHYEIEVNDPIQRTTVIARLSKYPKVDGEPTPLNPDLRMIIVKFKVKDKTEAENTTKELKKNFHDPDECTITEVLGYTSDISTEERRSRKERRDKRIKSFWYIVTIYLSTMLGGTVLTGFFNQATLQTSLHAWSDALFKAAMVAVPATLAAYKKKKPE